MGFFTSMRSTACVLAAALFLISCAGERAPEGGPVDLDPPVVVSTDPPNYTTQFRGNSITIEFSEYVDHRTVEGAIFISPSLGQLEFDWSGREVEIRFSEQLRRSTTYVVTVGTDVTDLRNRNKMAQSSTLAFSTGGDIDHGAIQGKVFPLKDFDPPFGIMIFAYNLNGLKPDTLDPKTTKPDYVTQTGKNGEFLLQHLSFGPYRLFAVRDEYRNLLYDPEVDECGVPSTEIALTPADTLRSGIWVRLTKEDTTALRLLRVSPTNERHVVVEFSSPIDTSNIRPDWFRIVDTLDQRQLGVQSVCPLFPRLTSALVVTDTQSSQAAYRLQIDSLRSASGLAMNPVANRLTFSASEAKDSVGPSILSFSIPDTSKEIDLKPIFVLHLSDAVQRKSAEKATVLLDSSRKVVPISFRWLSDASVEITPNVRLMNRAWYAFRVGMRSILDFAGKRGRDSLRVFRYQTVDEELFSSIEGVVSDTNATDAKGEIFLVARNVSRKESKEYVLQLGQGGPFVLRDVLEGKYLISAYRDRNGNKKYDPGRVFPFQPSERFTQHPDTMKVRARWPLEGVELKLR